MRTNLIKYSLPLFTGALVAISAQRSMAAANPPDTVALSATAENFHKALAAGKRGEVISLLQPDALIVEGGAVETRAEYESSHLGEDITYARAVPAKQLNVVVRQEGDVAWVTSTFSLTGRFQGKPIHSLAAETMVLTKIPAGWRIRAIHWSSHKVSKS